MYQRGKFSLLDRTTHGILFAIESLFLAHKAVVGTTLYMEQRYLWLISFFELTSSTYITGRSHFITNRKLTHLSPEENFDGKKYLRIGMLRTAALPFVWCENRQIGKHKLRICTNYEYANGPQLLRCGTKASQITRCIVW